MASPAEHPPILAPKPLKVGIIAGEMSGDLLGAGLMRAIKARHDAIEFVGIGGSAMMREGLASLVPMDRLAVMGLVEVLKRLPELLGIRKRAIDTFLNKSIDLFIGIDSPDFNLPIAKVLHERGIKTVHYVSPTVWAWRQKRVLSIAKSVNLMLVLFPFEEVFYRDNHVPVKYVGHPLAHQIDLKIDHGQVKRHWGFSQDDRVLAVLPGSRGGELTYMGPLFIDTLQQLYQLDNRFRFIVPLANQARREQFEQQLARHGKSLPIMLVDGHARDVMAGADAVLVTSGTATLEALLLKRPMVIAYRWGALTHAIISRMLKTPYIGLPNILANDLVVPEFVQQYATPDALTRAVLHIFDDPAVASDIRHRFDHIHQSLRRDADEESASAIMDLIRDHGVEWKEARDAAGL